jgi:hypothetical protein
VHLVDFIIRIYHDARSAEQRQMYQASNTKRDTQWHSCVHLTCTTNHHLQIQKSGPFKIYTGHIFVRKMSARKEWSCISTFWAVRKIGYVCGEMARRAKSPVSDWWLLCLSDVIRCSVHYFSPIKHSGNHLYHLQLSSPVLYLTRFSQYTANISLNIVK